MSLDVHMGAPSSWFLQKPPGKDANKLQNIIINEENSLFVSVRTTADLNTLPHTSMDVIGVKFAFFFISITQMTGRRVK